MNNTTFVTGGAGFIGANFVLDWFERGPATPLVNLDALTYAGNLASLAPLKGNAAHTFSQTDITDATALAKLFAEHRPKAVVHFAAESHVDRSIHGPEAFVETNVVGTFRLLQATLAYWRSLGEAEQKAFRFLHVSTDEVYGSLSDTGPAFSETTAYAPNSPYSASKAASDHFVRAYHHTYGLPVLTTNCSNNYGPLQFPEKLIPLMINKGLKGEPLPVYGDGLNVRDWLYVRDHTAAIRRVLEAGRVGEVYNVGGLNEIKNIDVVHHLCDILDELKPLANGISGSRRNLITYVKDRPGHDRRYAIDARKINAELNWQPAETYATGMKKTVAWYLDNAAWMADVTSGDYRKWLSLNYAA